MVKVISDRLNRQSQLKRQLKELEVEIDRQKLETEVAILTKSSCFQEIQQEVAEIDLDEFWS